MKLYLSVIFKELCRRLYSETKFFILRRDLTGESDIKEPKIALALRPLQDRDIPDLLNLNIPNLSHDGLIERLRISQMIKAGIRTCYVAANTEERICHVAWLIDASENEKFKRFFNSAVKPLAKNEILFEFAFTAEEFRNFGIQRWRIAKFIQMSQERAAKWAFSLIKTTNTLSIKNIEKNGFEKYLARTDKWRFFRRKVSYEPLRG